MRGTLLSKIFILAALISASCLTVLVSNPTSAHAHADIVSSDPPSGVTLEDAPEEIQLEFSGSVSIVPTSIILYDEDANRISIGQPQKRDSKTVFAGLSDLEPGTYLVTWNVVSADSHPLNGEFVFSVQVQLEEDFILSEKAQRVLEGQEVSKGVEQSLHVARFLIYFSISIILALLVFAFFVTNFKWTKAMTLVMYLAVISCILASFASVVIQHSLANQLSISQSLTVSNIQTELKTQFGLTNLLRIATALLIAFTWFFREKKYSKYVLIFLGAVLAFTPALNGHSRSGLVAPIAMGMTTLHVAAIGVWLGGLILLPFFLKSFESVEPLKKFSELSKWLVLAIAVTGAFAWWRQVGSLEAAQQTWFGSLTGYKTMLFIVTVAIAYFSRRHVKKLVSTGIGDVALKKKLIRNVYIEALVLLLVLSLSSVLVNAVPGRTALSLPVTQAAEIQNGSIEFVFDPPRANAQSEIHIYVLNDAGAPLQIQTDQRALADQPIVLTARNVDVDTDPVQIPMRYLGLNHFISAGPVSLFPGEWEFTATILLSAQEQVVSSVTAQYR